MPTTRFPHPRYRALALIALLSFGVAACDDDANGPATDPLAGLVTAERGDTAEAPPNQTPDGPGHFQGFVKGYTPGVVDTNSTIVPLANVRVTAYRSEAQGTSAQPEAGDAVATAFSNANGAWTLPTLPGGEYIVTFVPPAGSNYHGGWTVGQAWSSSGDSPWQIFLSKKTP